MIITFAHYKGGTGKTTSCLSVAGWLAKLGKKVLVIDLDPQANATSGLGIDKKTIEKSMYDVMKTKTPSGLMKAIILQTDIENLHIAPSSNQLELINIKSYKNKNDATLLVRGLEKIKEYYDFILIDTPPVYSHFIINGMAAADKIFVVLDPGIFALEGVEVIKEHFGKFFSKLGMKFNIDAALITKSQKYSFLKSLFKKNIANDIGKEVGNILDKPVFLIPYSDEVYETHRLGKPISHHKPHSDIGRAYEKIAKRLIDELDNKKITKQIEPYGPKKF